MFMKLDFTTSHLSAYTLEEIELYSRMFQREDVGFTTIKVIPTYFSIEDKKNETSETLTKLIGYAHNITFIQNGQTKTVSLDVVIPDEAYDNIKLLKQIEPEYFHQDYIGRKCSMTVTTAESGDGRLSITFNYAKE